MGHGALDGDEHLRIFCVLINATRCASVHCQFLLLLLSIMC